MSCLEEMSFKSLKERTSVSFYIAYGTSPRALFVLRKEACTAISTAYGYPRRFNIQYLHWTAITNRHLVGKKFNALEQPTYKKIHTYLQIQSPDSPLQRHCSRPMQDH